MSRTLLAHAILIAAALSGASAVAQSPPLLQPGEPYPGTNSQPIQLHPPVRRPAQEQGPAETQTAGPASISDEANNGDVVHLHRPVHPRPAKVAKAAPSPVATQEAIPFSFGTGSTAAPATAAAPAMKQATAPANTKAARTASYQPSSAGGSSDSGERANLIKRGAIMFEKGAPAPSAVQYKGLKQLADALSAALESGAARIQLEAYGGTPGDKSSDARRLSLRRALAVRQLLIDDGVPSARIDVRAMGGTEDNGPPDRVDVFVRAG